MAKKTNTLYGYVEVRKAGYHIREKASAKSKSTGLIVPIGERVTYLGKTDKGWHKVSYAGVIGWLYKQAGELIAVNQKYLTVKKGRWNVRTAPTSKGKILGTLNGGEKVLDQGESKDNYRLVIFENQNAWLPLRAIEKE